MVKVNTVDGQKVIINVRTVDQVFRKCDDDGTDHEIDVANIYKVAILVESEGGFGRRQILHQVITTALNAATSAYPAITYTIADLREGTRMELPQRVRDKSPTEIDEDIFKDLSDQEKAIKKKAGEGWYRPEWYFSSLLALDLPVGESERKGRFGYTRGSG